MTTLTKDCDQHVPDAEQIARGTGFRTLRDRILDLAAPQATDVVVDVGCGTGLLALELAGQVRRVWAIDVSASIGRLRAHEGRQRRHRERRWRHRTSPPAAAILRPWRT